MNTEDSPLLSSICLLPAPQARALIKLCYLTGVTAARPNLSSPPDKQPSVVFIKSKWNQVNPCLKKIKKTLQQFHYDFHIFKRQVDLLVK